MSMSLVEFAAATRDQQHSVRGLVDNDDSPIEGVA
jgi:hypothetical protein